MTRSSRTWRLTEHEALGSDEEAVRWRHAREAASILALLWLAALVIATVILLHLVERQTTIDAVLLEGASALGNVGLSSGITGPDLIRPGKAVLIAVTWMGRLEIVPVLVLPASLKPRRHYSDA